MRSYILPCRTVLQLAFALLISSATLMSRPAVGQNLFEPYQLSGPLVPFGDVIPGSIRISADGSRVIYLADQNTDGMQELFSVPIIGGTPVRLNGPLPNGGDVTADSLQISPNSAHVIYIADQNVDGVFELFSVPIAGGPSIRLNSTLPSGGQVFSAGAQVSRDSTRVVYLADQNTDGVLELFSVPIIGGVSTRLNDPLPNGADVSSEGVRISADSGRVIYLADQNTNDVIELFSVPISGGVPIRLNTALSGESDIRSSGLKVSSDSNYVTYLAVHQPGSSTELFSVPITGGVPVRLHAPLTLPNRIRAVHLMISADSSRVIYDTNGAIGSGFMLLSVPITGGTPVTLASTSRVTGRIMNVHITPDNSRVVYRSNRSAQQFEADFDAFSVPIAGGVNVKLNDSFLPDREVSPDSIRISADSNHVIYLADTNTDGVVELFSVPVTGGPSTRLNSTLPVGANVSSSGLQITSDSGHVVYLADQSSVGVTELFSVPITGGPPLRLNTILPFSSDVDEALLSSDGQYVIYLADQDVFDENELFAVKIAESASDDALCMPIKSSSGAIVVICL